MSSCWHLDFAIPMARALCASLVARQTRRARQSSELGRASSSGLLSARATAIGSSRLLKSACSWSGISHQLWKNRTSTKSLSSSARRISQTSWRRPFTAMDSQPTPCMVARRRRLASGCWTSSAKASCGSSCAQTSWAEASTCQTCRTSLSTRWAASTITSTALAEPAAASMVRAKRWSSSSIGTRCPRSQASSSKCSGPRTSRCRRS
mmetsp:Transcript_77006/g.152561  ORF Transcript_77006/g.152561 Transcript_77006/m.152561 type:complete len:208 (+) Transcript_77006:808-1431(+)